MGNYREFMSKGECLLNGILSTGNLILACVLAGLYAQNHEESSITIPAVILAALWLASCAFHWYRWFAYDKKK